MSNKWHALWQDKRVDDDVPDLGTLIAMVGWKADDGDLSTDVWLAFVDGLCRRLAIDPGTRVLEVGCGPGGLLLPLYRRGVPVWGIDYSESLIEICRRVMPAGHFHTGEANRMPYADAQFEVIVSNSVCHYFPDHAYAERVLAEMARCLAPGGRGAILDANDQAMQAEFMAHRYARFGGREEYERQNSDLPQLFYARDWMLETGRKYGLEGVTEDQHIPGYRNSRYRFNYFFTRA
jgi:ubiquinone/menaquinone biosynthesis C-methylase UbiE